jgi:hypothetical protein
MRKAAAFLLVVLICGGALLSSGPIHAEPAFLQYHLTWYVVGGGGAIGMAGDAHTLDATAGQTAIGWSENGQGLGSGFWYGIDRSGLWRIYLPLLCRQ